jgi:hypothetical protein
MKKNLLSALGLLFLGSAALAQTFTNGSSLLPTNTIYRSGGVTGVADVDHDGLDDIIVMHNSTTLFVLYQHADGTYTESAYGTVSSSAQWGMAVGDLDNDNYLDVITGGSYDGVRFVNINSPSQYTTQNYNNAQIFMQACNFADIDNDGWVDAFACHDDGESFIFRNDGTGTMVDGNSLIDLNIYPTSDNSGNYGTTWTDFDRDGDIDLFIAKCRQVVNDPLDPRRTNVLLVNDGNNNYHDEAHERGLVNLQQSWTSDFADVDNDGDFDCFLNTHSGTMELYENDGFGYFTSITASSGLAAVAGFLLQGKLEDMDNDGFVDIVYSGGVSGYLHNNGNSTFGNSFNPFPNTQAVVHSFAIGDLNNDGWLDVFTTFGNNYVTPSSYADRIYLNDTNANNWVSFDLTGVESNKRAIGAIVEIHGAWGVQIREVRAGESYGINNSFKCHFGIGSATEIDYAVIYWPSGVHQVIDNPSIGMNHQVEEIICDAPSATIAPIGATAICPGQTVELTVTNATGSILWSTGETANVISVNQTGTYHAIVTLPDGCANASNYIDITTAQEPTPAVTVEGDLEFCEGYSVQLTSSVSSGNVWSNGETTQSIVVTQPGNYTVHAIGAVCTSEESDAITVNVLDTPSAPAVGSVAVDLGGTATLNATGDNIRWYDSANATTPIATGTSFTTPAITGPTFFWVENASVYGGQTAEGGLLTNSADGQYFNVNTRYMIFDAYQDFIIESFKVYNNTAGNKTFEVRTSAGAVVANGTFNVSAGEQVVPVNFNIPAGTGYQMYCTSASPDLWRDGNANVDLPYPFALGTLGAITTSSVTGDGWNNYYYFFYDWKVKTPTIECVSPRTEIMVGVVGVNEISELGSTVVYPNPASSEINVRFATQASGLLQLNLIDQTGRVVMNNSHSLNPGENLVRMDVANVATGVYQLQFLMNGKVASTTLVVE